MNLLPLLHTWPSAYRKLIVVFVGIALTGVVAGGVFIELTTHLTPEGVEEQYRGLSEEKMETATEMKFGKTAHEMLITTHNHILGLSVLFTVMAFLFLHAGAMSGLRLAIAIEPLVSLVVTFGGLWIVRFVWPPFVYIVILSGTLMIGTFAWMGYRVLSACVRGDGYRSAFKKI